MRRVFVYVLYVGTVVIVFLISEYLVWLLTAFWKLYGAYIQFWIENGGAVLIVDVSLCSVVGAFYIALALKERPQNQYISQLSAGVPDCITGLLSPTMVYAWL